MTPLTGAQYEISGAGYRATITGLGAGLRELSYQGEPAIDGYQPDELPPGAAGELLLPWPNRVDEGRYTWGGETCQLDLSEPAAGNAIHGLTRWATWRQVSRAPDAVRLAVTLLGRSGYPFCLEIDAGYRVTAAGLEVTVTASNPGSRAAPYGVGAHPYLTAGLPQIDDCELELPAQQWLPADDRGIPAGPARDVAGTPADFRARRAIGGTRLDHALTGLARDSGGRAWARLSGGGRQVALWAGPGCGWLQVFTGDPLGPPRGRRALAVEPMTCPPNAFNSGTDVLSVAPGGSVSHSWGIQVTPDR
ncbi:MAG: aldose 1-epimerase family protein [Nocardiopsaceae bacterium]|jgi:aldose 1-epimerase|nr:aldose 1-epimerase family protein [Nocardiopsaceae bacterium]